MLNSRLGIGGAARMAEWAVRKYLFRQHYHVARVNDYKMYLDLRVAGVSRPLAVYGTREEDKTAILKNELKPGMIHVDLGANIGYYALMAAKIVGPAGRVLCLEPDPRNLELLRRNVELNGFTAPIEICAVAASDHPGTATMYQAHASNLNTLVAPQERQQAADPVECKVSVKTVTLDDFMDQRGGILNFLRMDIEGFEVDALRGGLRTLERSPAPCKILLETHPNMYGPNRDFGALLQQLYSMRFVPKSIVSAGQVRPKVFADLGYSPERIYHADGFERGYYEHVSPADVITLVTTVPKAVRYLLLTKEA